MDSTANAVAGTTPEVSAVQNEPVCADRAFSIDNSLSDFPGFRLHEPTLTAEELDILAALENKERVLRARIRAIALPSYTGVRGLFLYGNPGHGKSHILRTELDAVCGPGKWRLYNSDMSPPALLAEMEAHRTLPLVLEDCEQLLANAKNRGVLRSAMAPPYRVNPKNMRTPYDFIFQAAIYILANLPLDERHGVLAAIASRTGPIHWQLTCAELAARMKSIALQPDGDELTVVERWEVAEYCIDRLNMGGRVDLRTFCDAALPARRHHKRGELNIDWRDYVDSYVRGTVAADPERRDKRIQREQHIACEIYHEGKDTAERHRLWEEKTGLKKTAFSDRLREARSNGVFGQFQRTLGKAENVCTPQYCRATSSLEQKYQLFRTPPEITRALLRLEDIGGSVLEPCVGKGDLVQELLTLPNVEVSWSDLHDWGFDRTEVRDFFSIEGEHYDCLVTNPPHAKPANFVRRAKLLADKVAALLPLHVEHNVNWHDLRNDKEYPLKAVYAFTQSIQWVDWHGNRWGKIKYGWFVFEKRYKGPTIRKNITFRDSEVIVD
jgi:hypothetical protein